MRNNQILKDNKNNNFINKNNNNINQHVKVLEFDTLGINGSNFNNNKVNQKKNINNGMNIKQQIFKQQKSLNNYNHQNHDNQNNKNILSPITNFGKNESKANNNNNKNNNNNNNNKNNNNNLNNKNSNNTKPINKKTQNLNDKNNNKKSQKQTQNKNLYDFNPDDVIYEDTYEEINFNENNPKNKENEQKVINTIKMVSNNRNKYQHTNKIFQEIGRMINNPVLNFLTQKEAISSSSKKNNNNNKKKESFDPSEKLSEKLSEKMMKYQKEIEEHYNPKKEEEKSDEDIYYYNLQKKIKEEIKKKGSFDFEKLSENDRKLLAQRKLYDKIGNNKNNDYNKENINEKISNEINREIKKEKFFDNSNISDINEQNKINKKYDDTELYENIKKGQKELKESNYLLYNDLEFDGGKKDYLDNLDELEKKIYSDNPDERPTAKDILTNLLSKIEYKNQQLINHNNEIENELNKKLRDKK